MSILAQGFLSESCILAKLCKGGRVPTSWLPRLHKEVSFGLKSSATSRILFVDERALVGTISEIPFLLTPPRSHPPPPPHVFVHAVFRLPFPQRITTLEESVDISCDGKKQRSLVLVKATR